MTTTLGTDLGRAIAELMGLSETRTIVITIPHNDFVTVDVDYLMSDPVSKHITGFLQHRRFRIQLLEEGEPVNIFEASDEK